MLANSLNQDERFKLPIQINEIVVGITYSGVLLETGHLGIISTQFKKEGCISRNKTSKIGRFSEVHTTQLLESLSSPFQIDRTIALATVNALSQKIMEEEKEHINYQDNREIFEILSKYPKEPIFMIGAIGPLINKFKQEGRKVYIKDFSKNLEFKKEGEQILSEQRGIAIISGSAISNNTLTNVLEYLKNTKFKVLIGPSAQILPDIIFELTAIDAVASMHFKAPLKVMKVIKEAGGTPQFQKFANKYMVIR